jgi:formate dehydrogenase major subunit
MGVLNNYTPGYLNWPSHNEPTLDAWTQNNGTLRRKFLVNMLKAFYGDAATPENDSLLRVAAEAEPDEGLQRDRHLRGRARGLAQAALDHRPEPGRDLAEPAGRLRRARQARHARRAGAVGDGNAAFWERPGADPSKIQTEVLLLPPRSSWEKNGSISNSGGMVQWRTPP